jgi:molybdenum cofactor cytidylyltransferase
MVRNVAGLVLAAGLSRRMGTAKMVLPWGNSTVIETVVSSLLCLELSEIVVVTGGARQSVEQRLIYMPVRCVINPVYENGEMLDSIQVGLASLSPGAEAVLVALGDQPQMEPDTGKALLEKYAAGSFPLVLPSYQMRRGHPWLIREELWPEIMALHAPQTMRDFMRVNAFQIDYVEVQTPSILMDLDTPEDYHKSWDGIIK